jgi:hypothetical protein
VIEEDLEDLLDDLALTLPSDLCHAATLLLQRYGSMSDCTDAVVDYVRGLCDAFVADGEPISLFEKERWLRGSDGYLRRSIISYANLIDFTFKYANSDPERFEAAKATGQADDDFVAGGRQPGRV